MRLQSSVLLKETRPMLGPWFLISLAGATPALLPFSSIIGDRFIAVIYGAGFWIGLPLLATISLGNEFQFRTIPLLLSQPVNRMKIWNTKWLVAVTTVFSSALVYSFQRDPFLRGDWAAFLACCAWLIIAVSSATFWILVAQSTIGGLVLNLMQACIILTIAALVNFTLGRGFYPMATELSPTFAFPLAVCYSVFMIWLGRRKLARFQSTGTIAGDDVLVNHPQIMRIFTGWLRCRPQGALLNLVRKEIRLLWPVWLFTALCIALLIAVAPLQLVLKSTDVSVTNVPFIAVAIVTLYGFFALLLTGSISVGEEKALGARAWQMTLPVSPDVQWLVKLMVVLLTTFAGLILVVNSGYLLLGKPFLDTFDGSVGRHDWVQLLQLASLSLVGFWCACAVNGTVRSLLTTIPAAYTIALAAMLAEILTRGLRSMGLFFVAAERFHTYPFKYDIYDLLMHHLGGPKFRLSLFALPFLLAVLDSRRLFRTEVPDRFVASVRILLRPVIAIFLIVLFLQAVHALAIQNWELTHTAIVETHNNIRRLHLDLSATDEAHPRSLTPQEAQSVLSSKNARQWLTTNISVFISRPEIRGQRKIPATTQTTIELANGLKCTAIDFINFRTGLTATWSWVRCKDQLGKEVRSPWY